MLLSILLRIFIFRKYVKYCGYVIDIKRVKGKFENSFFVILEFF